MTTVSGTPGPQGPPSGPPDPDRPDGAADRNATRGDEITDRQDTDRPAAERAGAERAGTESAGAERAGADRPGAVRGGFGWARAVRRWVERGWGSLPVGVRRVARTGWALVRGTTVTAFRHRVTGLAAEAAFFALLSLPPLAIGLVGTMGHFTGLLGADTIADSRAWLIEQAQRVLTPSAVHDVVVPLVDDVIKGGRPDLVSVGFLLSLWAGSRATNVYVDTITIAYGLSGVRGMIRTRVRAFLLYLVGLVVMIVVIPLLVAGPSLARRAVPDGGLVIELLYWPVVVTLTVLFLALLYHMSVPVRTNWWREVPGAVLALVILVFGSFFLRTYLAGSLSGVSVYGSLSAAIAVLGWLYVAALAVLIGAALNAEIDRRWPSAGTARARAVRAAGTPDGGASPI